MVKSRWCVALFLKQAILIQLGFVGICKKSVQKKSELRPCTKIQHFSTPCLPSIEKMVWKIFWTRSVSDWDGLGSQSLRGEPDQGWPNFTHKKMGIWQLSSLVFFLMNIHKKDTQKIILTLFWILCAFSAQKFTPQLIATIFLVKLNFPLIPTTPQHDTKPTQWPRKRFCSKNYRKWCKIKGNFGNLKFTLRMPFSNQCFAIFLEWWPFIGQFRMIGTILGIVVWCLGLQFLQQWSWMFSKLWCQFWRFSFTPKVFAVSPPWTPFFFAFIPSSFMVSLTAKAKQNKTQPIYCPGFNWSEDDTEIMSFQLLPPRNFLSS